MLFNNFRRRPHAELFGTTAFYDLMTTGKQASMAVDLPAGQHCCVATPTEDGGIEFGWFAFSRERLVADPADGVHVRVFFGDCLGTETLSREEAMATEPYAQFFNVNGHFKRPSAIPPRGPCVAPASVVGG